MAFARSHRSVSMPGRAGAQRASTVRSRRNSPYNQARAAVQSRLTVRRVTPSASAVSSDRSEEHTSELQSLMLISYAVLCLKKKHQYHTLQTGRATLYKVLKTHNPS